MTCLTLLIAVLLVLALMVFAQSAVIVLPWTMGASIAAVLATLGVDRLFGRKWPSRGLACGALAFGLVWAFGLAAYRAAPPVAPPQKQGLEALVAPIEVGQKDLDDLFPIHLAIWASLVGVCVGLAFRRRSPPAPATGKEVTWVEEV